MKGFKRLKEMENMMNKHGVARMAAVAFSLLGVCFGGGAQATTATATTDAFRLSIKHDGIRQSAGDETLTYSSLWDGDAGAMVTITQDGVAIAEGLETRPASACD